VASSKHLLVTNFSSPSFKWYLINIYAPNTRAQRQSLWTDLSSTLTKFPRSRWMLAGDFNTPLYPSEKYGGNIDYFDSMFDFAEFINAWGLLDVELQDQIFT